MSKPIISDEDIERIYRLDDWQQDDCPGSEQLAPCWHDLRNAARRLLAEFAERVAAICEKRSAIEDRGLSPASVAWAKAYREAARIVREAAGRAR